MPILEHSKIELATKKKMSMKNIIARMILSEELSTRIILSIRVFISDIIPREYTIITSFESVWEVG